MFGVQSKIQLGQYQLLEEVGSGGMATVYKAYQPSLDRFVAVKVMHSSADPQFTARFKREARAIASLQHHNILPIYDYGEQDGWLYFVLQYIEHGVTLSSLLADPMSSLTALRLIGHVLIALDYAHTRGIIHRDVKPSNILMAAPNWPMLADFGIARLVGEDQRLTISGSIIGTAAYMAPEQALGQPVDARTDLYATGAMLYEMLTGQIPFGGDTPVVVLTKHVVEPPLPLRAINPDLSLALETAVLRALAKNPADRYQSAVEMADDLAWIATQCEQPLAQEQLLYLYHSSVEAFEQGQWNLSIARLARLLTIDPNYEDASELLHAARESQERALAAAQAPFIDQQPQPMSVPILPLELATPAAAQGTTREDVVMPAAVVRAADVRPVTVPRRPWAWPAVSAVLLFMVLLGAIDMHQSLEHTNQAGTAAGSASIVAPPSLLALGRGLIDLFVAPARAAEITVLPTNIPSMLFLARARFAIQMLTPTARPTSIVERVSRGGAVAPSAGPVESSSAGVSNSSPAQPLATSGVPSQINATPQQGGPQIFVTTIPTATLLTFSTPTAGRQSTVVAASPTAFPVQASPTSPSLPGSPSSAPGVQTATATSLPVTPAQPSPTARATPPPVPPPQVPTSQPLPAPQVPTPRPTQVPTATQRPTQAALPPPASTATSRPAPTATSQPVPPPAPTATSRPASTATSQPVSPQAPTATSRPAPTATPQPAPPQAPTATPRPAPTATSRPAPSATPQPAPPQAPTATPQPAPTQVPTATKAPTATPPLGLPLPTLPLPPLPTLPLPPLPTLPRLP